MNKKQPFPDAPCVRISLVYLHVIKNTCSGEIAVTFLVIIHATGVGSGRVAIEP